MKWRSYLVIVDVGVPFTIPMLRSSLWQSQTKRMLKWSPNVKQLAQSQDFPWQLFVTFLNVPHDCRSSGFSRLPYHACWIDNIRLWLSFEALFKYFRNTWNLHFCHPNVQMKYLLLLLFFLYKTKVTQPGQSCKTLKHFLSKTIRTKPLLKQ